MDNKIWTIGHSNKTFPEFLEMLQAYEIKMLADVRRYPGSAKYPHFNQETLGRELKKYSIGYKHFPELGGRRKALPDSKNTIWRNEAFKGYADYMETEAFKAELSNFIAAASKAPTAIMCSEVLWWRCHRSLISDLLKTMDFKVLHIMSPTKIQEHPFTKAARIIEGKLSYKP